MIARMLLGGVWVHFGRPQAVLQPIPFYPYLIDAEPIADATGEETASTAFTLVLKAQPLVGLALRGSVELLDDFGKVIFAGVVGRVAYSEQLRITVEA